MEDKKIKLRQLVENFRANINQYKTSIYDEANTRVDFIDKFFEILDWDVSNEQGASETYREVIREDKVIIQGKPKAPDYSFRIGGRKVFFVEAKKPSVDLKEAIEPAYQLRRYSYSAKLPVSILTDFEELAVYDTRIKPDHEDKASVARIFYCTYDEYEKNFDFIYNTFSRNAVFKGALERYVETNKGKKGTSEVDKEFLELIEEWRNELAKSIARQNKEIDIYNLNFAVQKIIDRLIFLRIAEDRGMEEYQNLSSIVDSSDNVYASLKDYFNKADKKYNSELFKYNEFLANLAIDDKVFKGIIKGLYFPECPYEFSVLPIEILGNIYEQFLGKTIRLTAGHQAKIEEKPEVKKAGGVYYTPQYIVSYIVKNTIGEKIEDKSLKDIENLRVLDPACGSGSFLIGAYIYILSHHLQFYSEDKNVKKSLKEGKIYQVSEKTYRLTIQEKQRILLNNIYGVDIDQQAVEVTKLSLLLKLLEGETNESSGQLFKYSDFGILPDLSKNIKCGNSLIGPDFYNEKDLSLFGKEEMRVINTFDWQKEFPEVFSLTLDGRGQGEGESKCGFDVVIGNPPWVFTKYVDWGVDTKDYITNKYLSTTNSISSGRAKQAGKINLFAIFILQSINIMKNNGIFGYIIPNTLLRTTIYDIVRKQILDKTKIKLIVDLKSGVFENVTASTIIVIFEKNQNIEGNLIDIINNPERINKVIDISSKICQNLFFQNPSYNFNIFANEKDNIIFEKIKSKSNHLKEFVNIYNGIATYKNKEGIVTQSINDKCKKIIFGKDIARYFHSWSGKYVEYIPQKLQRARNENIFLAPEKLIMQRIGGILITSYDDEKYCTFNSVNNILLEQNKYSLKYILGIINSKLMKYYYIKNFTNESTLTVNISKTYLDELPIPKIDLSINEDKHLYGNIVLLVNQMIETKKLFHPTKSEEDIKIYQQKADLLDKQIDNIVYQLYGLTDDEIKIIESS